MWSRDWHLQLITGPMIQCIMRKQTIIITKTNEQPSQSAALYLIRLITTLTNEFVHSFLII